jgi:hypothetical protein
MVTEVLSACHDIRAHLKPAWREIFHLFLLHKSNFSHRQHPEVFFKSLTLPGMTECMLTWNAEGQAKIDENTIFKNHTSHKDVFHQLISDTIIPPVKKPGLGM